jgi:energy-converting hydrogenase Eha subunit C
METNNLVRYGSIVLALCVIVASIWVIVTPPIGDDIQGIALMAIGFFMLIVVYYIMRLEHKCGTA